MVIRQEIFALTRSRQCKTNSKMESNVETRVSYFRTTILCKRHALRKINNKWVLYKQRGKYFIFPPLWRFWIQTSYRTRQSSLWPISFVRYAWECYCWALIHIRAQGRAYKTSIYRSSTNCCGHNRTNLRLQEILSVQKHKKVKTHQKTVYW